MATSDPNKIASDLRNDGERAIESAFKQALTGVQAVATQLAPVGHYGRRRGKPGKSGGDLRSKIRTEYLGVAGGLMKGRVTCDLAYAAVQHEELFSHPGIYTGAAGPKYRSLYAKAAVQFVFSVDGNSGLYNPGNLPVVEPARFKELLEEA